jgi:hypothetical protein
MPARNPSIVRLILIPSIITLAVTLVRLMGELKEWSTTFFNPAPGGGMAIVGIVWLVPIFGIFFAWKLAGAGRRPKPSGRAIGIAVLGFILLAAGFVLFNFILGRRLRFLFLMWGLAAVAAGLQYVGWPALFKVLLAYGYAARIPVAIIMYLAAQNVWESHYSPLIVPVFEMSSSRQYLLFGLAPQLIWWVSFTVVVGSLFGSITAALVPQPAAAAASRSRRLMTEKK